MQIFVSLFRFCLIALLKGSDGLVCDRCAGGFEAVANVFVEKNVEIPGCLDHQPIECQSTDVCLLETIRKKDVEGRFTVISGCQPKSPKFTKDFCVYKDLPQGEFYRCRCDSDNCNAEPTDILEDKFDIVVDNDDDLNPYDPTVPIDWIDQINNPNSENEKNDAEYERRKREAEQKTNHSDWGLNKPNEIFDKLLKNNETRAQLLQAKEEAEALKQQVDKHHKATIQESPTEPLKCAKCTIKSGKEELCESSHVSVIDESKFSGKFWCVNSFQRVKGEIKQNLRFAMKDVSLLQFFNTTELMESCKTSPNALGEEIEMCICRKNFCNNKLMADMKAKLN